MSLSGCGTLNGEVAELYKQTSLLNPSSRYVWIEENDPRGENLGSWIMNQGNVAQNFAGAQLIDSTANFHGNASTFNFADGHAESKKWLDAALIRYSDSMDPNKFSNTPSDRTAPRDVKWLAQRYPSRANP